MQLTNLPVKRLTRSDLGDGVAQSVGLDNRVPAVLSPVVYGRSVILTTHLYLVLRLYLYSHIRLHGVVLN